MNLNPIHFNRSQIYLLFYKPNHEDPIQNRIVAQLDGPFCHVEMAFPEKYGEEPWEKTIYGSSIYQNESVFFKKKSYQREGYVSFAIEVSNSQYHKIKKFCQDQMNAKIPFSRLAMYAAYLPFQIYYTNATFCSKHVSTALQHANVDIAMNLNPSITSPSKLYKYLISQSPILQVVPSKMTQDNINSCTSKLIKFMIDTNKAKRAISC